MKKLVAVTTFAIVGLGTHSATACDWNHEAAANDQVVATSAPEKAAEQPSASTPRLPTSVASDESTRKVVEAATPIVMITSEDH
jgi:ornithine cyclodeaminase/alanine dehydrogenase-like protein (mu-crystallin family)